MQLENTVINDREAHVLGLNWIFLEPRMSRFVIKDSASFAGLKKVVMMNRWEHYTAT